MASVYCLLGRVNSEVYCTLYTVHNAREEVNSTQYTVHSPFYIYMWSKYFAVRSVPAPATVEASVLLVIPNTAKQGGGVNYTALHCKIYYTVLHCIYKLVCTA